ncbi:Glucan endo-1,3-beta-glucosidase [Acorus gramineus]|uniref:glucan endo-1,3-beta-D-glucosidase n=1 Tax=Acorus gramineus TaxID=55184 RepID=A0AAV8ZZ85_ACOGR|nr:Glucan endo-1,3-beta-glucosidase [Acorus gramineus]
MIPFKPLTKPLLLVLLTIASAASTALSIGVNYGTLADNLPPPPQVAAFLKQRTYIDRVKLFSPDPALLRAFAGTGIAVTVTAANGDIPALARSPSAASAWVSANLIPFVPATNITRVAVGNEILATGDRVLISLLLRSMRSLSAAISAAGLHIQVSTPHSLGILSVSEPPSSGRFRRGYDRAIIGPILDYHRKTKTPFLINPYPYFGFAPKTLNYALFKPNPGVFDAVTGINYTNMFDAQMDAVYTAMKRLGYGDVDIVVAETGWPSAGDPDQTAVNVENAMSYNGNLIRHVSSGRGTPLMPNRRFETYVFSLFNENLKPSTSERNFGLFKPDLTPVYDVGVLREASGGGPTPTTTPTPTPAPKGGKKWCVARGDASAGDLQSNIDYACAHGADCKSIQSGGACYQPDTLLSHASYAMNSYYQISGRNDFDCDFAKTGLITTVDPSTRFCLGRK